MRKRFTQKKVNYIVASDRRKRKLQPMEAAEKAIRDVAYSGTLEEKLRNLAVLDEFIFGLKMEVECDAEIS